MKKEDLIKLGLDEDTAQKVADASAEELKTFVPKTRFDEVNNTKKDLETQVSERDKQLEELKKVDAKGLQVEIERLQGENKTKQEEFEQKLKETNLSTALKLALSGKVHDADLMTSLLDKEKIELDDDGNVKNGLDEQLKELQKSKSFLFVSDDPNIIAGVKPATGDTNPGEPVSVATNLAKQANERSKADKTTLWD